MASSRGAVDSSWGGQWVMKTGGGERWELFRGETEVRLGVGNCWIFIGRSLERAWQEICGALVGNIHQKASCFTALSIVENYMAVF